MQPRPPKSARQKLDPQTRIALDEETLTGAVEVLLRLALDPPANASDQLEAAGLAVRSHLGAVLSGRTEAANLLRVAALPFVQGVEVSRQLHQERNGGGA